MADTPFVICPRLDLSKLVFVEKVFDDQQTHLRIVCMVHKSFLPSKKWFGVIASKSFTSELKGVNGLAFNFRPTRKLLLITNLRTEIVEVGFYTKNLLKTQR